MRNSTKSYWKDLLDIISNERGAVGDEEEKPDGDEITAEEQALLDADDTKDGEDDPSKKDDEKDPDKKDDEAGDDKGDKDKDEVLTPEQEQAAFYEKYPDLKLKEEKEDDDKGGDDKILTDGQDPGAMSVKGGEFDGKTLNEVYAINPGKAMKLYNDYVKDEDAAEAKETAGKQERIDAADKDIKEFTIAQKNELFGDKDELSDEEATQLAKVVEDTLVFIETTGRASSMSDAHFLMNRKAHLASAASGAAQSVANSLDQGASQVHVSTAKGGGDETGFEAYEAMSEEKLESVIDDWDDEKVSDFYKNAPKSLRNKHPNIPWD